MDDISHGIRQKKVAAFYGRSRCTETRKSCRLSGELEVRGYGAEVALHQSRFPVGIILPEFALSVQVVKTGFMYMRFSQ